MGVQIGISGADEDCNLTIGGRRTGWKDPKAIKTQNEIACVERFLSSTGVEFKRVIEQPQYSVVDALAELNDGSLRKFQVTSIWSPDFLKPFGATGAVDRQIGWERFRQFIIKAIEKKNEAYRGARLGDVVLLLDTHPAQIDRRCLTKLGSEPSLRGLAGDDPTFAEIWLADPNGSIRII